MRQCQLLELARSTRYYQPRGESERNLHLMRLLDEQYTRTPFYGVPKMTEWLRRQGEVVNEKRVRRLLHQLGLEAVYPKSRLSKPAVGHRIYPYLLRNVAVTRVNQVWSSDITYIRLHPGFVYLVAIIDWFSRFVLSWEVSITLESNFCVAALDWALQLARRISSTPTRAPSSPAMTSPDGYWRSRFRSVWMGAVARWIIFLWSACGGR